MHADFNELSEVAAGRFPSSAHVAACPQCLAELARVRAVRTALGGLPAATAPAGAWAGALARAAARRQASPARAATPAGLAMAASLVAMLAAAILLAQAPAQAPLAEQPIPLAQPIDGLVAENARLEAMLADRIPRTVMFVAAQGGEGTSTVVARFAWALTTDSQLHVLLVDLHARRPGYARDGHPLTDDPSRRAVTGGDGRSARRNLDLMPVPEAVATAGGAAPQVLQGNPADLRARLGRALVEHAAQGAH